MNKLRPVGSGAAWQHGSSCCTKNLQGEREKRKIRKEKEKRGEEKEKRGEKGKKGREEQEEKCIVGVKNTLFELSENYKRHGKGGGGEKTQGKDPGERWNLRRDRNGRRKDDRLRYDLCFIQVGL